MPTEKPRVMLTVDAELYNQIEDIRYENRFPSRSAAINELIRLGIEAIMKERDSGVDGLRRQLDAAIVDLKLDEGNKTEG